MASRDEEAVRSVVDRWTAATRAGDLGAVLKLMSHDAIFSVPGREPFGREQFGREQFAEGFKKLSSMKFRGENEILELTVFGAYAWTRNHVRVALETPDGEAVEREARTLTIYKREADGEWRLDRDANLPV